MKSHSDITTNMFGEPEKKKVYQLGDLVCIYLQSKNKYVYGLIVEIDNRNWIGEPAFQKLYTVYLQEGKDGTKNTVIRYQPDIYLAEAIERLNETHQQLKLNKHDS